MTIFKDLVVATATAGLLGESSDESREWYQDQVVNIKRTQVAPKRFTKDNKDLLVSRPVLGKMYAFLYEPLTKSLLKLLPCVEVKSLL